MPTLIKRSPSGRYSPREVVASGLCVGCGSCVGQAGGRAQMRMDRYGQLKPQGPRDWYRQRTAAFTNTCPFSPAAADEELIAGELYPKAREHDPLIGRFEAAYVGAVREADFRERGSSGGMVTWVATELLRRGLVDAVAHVVADTEAPAFRYQVSRTQAEVRAGAKSRYYPIELSGVIETVRAQPGRYAVVGIPCFIKAINLLRAQDEFVRERVAFTLGLYCGHMKSARMVESFAWQMGLDIDEVSAVDYRLKDPSRPANWYTAQLRLKDGGEARKDWWHLADGDWGAGFFQNSACDVCDDVVAETADISFGDAWVEPYSSDGRGTNVVIVRSPLLHELLRDGIAGGRLELTPVDAAFVEQTQAAGFRQRREGLALRLQWRRGGLRPPKRANAPAGLPLRRRLVYRMRRHIAAWSHRVFHLARLMHWPGLYVGWARAMLAIYQGLTYSRGRIGAAFDRCQRLLGRPAQA